eukprot:TRINITY_DN811_c0_g1_i5.p1 TRINITY_DN811_c0_g1~~TRINITY_DN811_c0_g1_i5.p1  ORF type:complete len:991 (-),score=287.09 TRINITY_DN811_c0_g1_i5:236-3151(-)
MASKELVILFFVLTFTFLATLVQSQDHRSGFSTVVSSFSEFQDSEGGFRTTRRVHGSSLEATSNALFLSSLYGLRHKVNPQEVTRYLQTLENADGGYAFKAGEPSHLEATRQVILSYQYLGIPFPNSLSVATFIRELLRPESGLFAASSSQKGDIKSTALALQSMKLLGEIERGYVQDTFKGINAYLKKNQQTGEKSFFNFTDSDLSPLSANYYGLVVSSFTGYQLPSPKSWATTIVSLQDSTGGFFSGPARNAKPTFESTFHAISSLSILKSVQLADLSTLKNFLESAPADLVEAGFAHHALALTPLINDYFETSISYEVLDSSPIKDRIVQGTKVKPVLSIQSFNTPHSGFEATVQWTHGDKKESRKLEYLAESHQYVTVEFHDTSNLLGSIKFDFELRNHVPEVGEIQLRTSDEKKVGYGIVVESSSVDANGRDLAEGDSVSVGSEFKFNVRLHNHTEKNFRSGPFSVIFTVFDSSSAKIHRETMDCSRNRAAISFSYSLKLNSIPAGELRFVFDVENDDQQVHTSHSVLYRLSIPMVAQSLSIKANGAAVSGPLKFGDKLSLTVKPANFPDLHSIQDLELSDSDKKKVQRKFVAELSSPRGTLLHQVEGKPDAQGRTYQFEYTVAPNLDFVGTNVVTFSYVSASGEKHRLLNYDDATKELFDDNFSLNYTVQAELYVTGSKTPIKSDLYYGNEVSLSFKVQDKISKQFVKKGNSDANVYLSLKHQDSDKKRTFTNAEVAAQQEGEVFTLNWSVSPNAIRGAGVIVIATKDADGKESPLYKEGTNKELTSYTVAIGGDIEVSSKTFTSGSLLSQTKETAFVVQFALSCQQQVLKDAQLRVNVTHKASQNVIAGLPVVSDGTNSYQVSWTVPSSQATTGQYVLEFFREVDRQRANENREFRERQRRLGVDTGADSSDDELKSFFELVVDHRPATAARLPVRTELLVLGLLFGAYLVLAKKKMEYSGSKF